MTDHDDTPARPIGLFLLLLGMAAIGGSAQLGMGVVVTITGLCLMGLASMRRG
jgi:hypothetical protein